MIANIRSIIISVDGARKQSVTLPHDDLPRAFAWGFFCLLEGSLVQGRSWYTFRKPEPEKPVAGKVFKIQFLVSRRNYRKGAPQLKGLDNVEIVKSGDLYKYFYGSTSFKSKRDDNLRRVKARGFPDAIIAEFPTEEPQQNISFDNDKNKTDIYRIQILSSQSNLNENSPLLKGLNNISKIKEGNSFKYLYGNFDSEESAKTELKNIRTAKFPDAFIVLLKNGNKIIIH